MFGCVDLYGYILHLALKIKMELLKTFHMHSKYQVLNDIIFNVEVEHTQLVHHTLAQCEDDIT